MGSDSLLAVTNGQLGRGGRDMVRAALAALAAAPLRVVACILAAYTTPAERRAAENARIKKQAVGEITRICALPEAEREAELKKIKDQLGMVLYRGSK
jgi:hypothetical protein